MIKKFCFGLEITIPKKSIKKIWNNRVPIIEELVACYYWKDTGSKLTQKKYKDFIDDTGIQFDGELDVELYKKEPVYQIGYLEWFWIEYPEYKRDTPQYRKDLKKILFTNQHPQMKSFSKGFYEGIKRDIKQCKKQEDEKIVKGRIGV